MIGGIVFLDEATFLGGRFLVLDILDLNVLPVPQAYFFVSDYCCVEVFDVALHTGLSRDSVEA